MIKAIKINGIDITDGISSKSFTYQERIDEAFATGSVNIRSDKIKYNIPPNSIMNVYDENDIIIKQFIVSSNSIKYLTTDKWVQECTLLELTSLLTGFILGSKNFSVTGTNRSDFEKIQIIRELIQQDYPEYNFVYNVSPSLFNQNIEYTFGAGTTMYDALNEIARHYNHRVVVKSYIADTITIEFKNVSGQDLYKLKNENILNVTFNQNVDDYCNELIFEAQNVIDRNQIVEVNDLTIRGDELATTLDNCLLILPTNAERIVSMEASAYNLAKCHALFHLNKRFKDIMGLDNTTPAKKTFNEWIELTGGVSSPLQELITNYLYRCDRDSLGASEFWANAIIEDYVAFYSTEGSDIKTNLMPYTCLDEARWNALENKTKAQYCYHSSGDNKILGMSTFFNDDFWHQIIGADAGPFIKYPNFDEARIDYTSINPNDNVLTAEITFSRSSKSPNVTEASFDIKYIAMINPIIIDRKDILPINEAKFKHISRSYDNSANFIDYDLLADRMHKDTNMIGTTELSIQYSLDGITPPSVGQRVNYDGTTYYLTSCVYTHLLQKDDIILNFSRSYSKIAQAIGVETQYNKTKLPLNNIIDRPIKFEPYTEPIKLNNKNAFVRIAFKDEYGQIFTALYKRLVYQVQGNKALAYVEMLDNRCFDRKANKITNTKFEILDVPYTDELGEVTQIEVRVGLINNELTYNDSLNLPELDNANRFTTLAIFNKYIYKDARERLTFTMQFTNAKVS